MCRSQVFKTQHKSEYMMSDHSVRSHAFRYDYKREFDYEYEFLETFRFDCEYEFDYEYDFLETFRFDYEFECKYDFLETLRFE